MPVPKGGSLELTLPPQISYTTLSSITYTGLVNVEQTVASNQITAISYPDPSKKQSIKLTNIVD